MRWRFGVVSLIAIFGCAVASTLRADTFELDPAHSRLSFALPATLHTVHGTFGFTSGTLRFDPTTGEASGALVVDATSAATENAARDRTLHKRVLESTRFGEIRLTPRSISLPHPAASPKASGPGSGLLVGDLWLLGRRHPIEISFSLRESEAGRLRAEGRFPVPYVQWGLRDVSNLVLRVDPVVEVTFIAEGVLQEGPSSP